MYRTRSRVRFAPGTYPPREELRTAADPYEHDEWLPVEPHNTQLYRDGTNTQLYGDGLQQLCTETRNNLQSLQTSMKKSDPCWDYGIKHWHPGSRPSSAQSSNHSTTLPSKGSWQDADVMFTNVATVESLGKTSLANSEESPYIEATEPVRKFCYLCTTMEEHERHRLHNTKPKKYRGRRWVDYIAPKPKVRRKFDDDEMNEINMISHLYKIEVWTGNKLNAGTCANVTVIIKGTQGLLPKTKLSRTRGSSQFCFMRNTRETFYVKGPYLGNLEAMAVEHDGVEEKHSWFLDKIEVTDMKTLLTWEFLCGQWFSLHIRDYRIQRDLLAKFKELSKREYKILVFTGKKHLSGTNSNVFLTLYGSERNSKRIRLDPTGSNKKLFERGNMDTFMIQANDVGKLRRIRESATNSVSSVGSYYKLPNLTLPSFSGDFLGWQTFWDSYQSSIHNNIGLTDVQKFSYLRAQLQGEASQCIAGLPLTSANYQQAIDLLTERFGQHHKIITACMQSLIDLPSPKNSNGLKYFYDRMETYIRNLQSLGQCQDSYGTLLIPIIIGKLPADVRRNISRDNGSDKWELNSLRERIRKEISIQEAGDFESSEKNIIPTASFITKTSQSSVYETGPERRKYTGNNTRNTGQYVNPKPCLFCQGSHSANNCTSVTETSNRIEIVKEKNVCFNCFGTHKIAYCRSKYRCRHCGSKHHSSICTSKLTYKLPANMEPNTEIRDNRSKENRYNNRSSRNSESDLEESTAILHSCTKQDKQTPSDVLLKTATAPVWSGRQCMISNILFDEGAQRSFITSDLAAKLQITPTGTTFMQISSFGGAENTVRRLEKCTIQLKTTAKDKISMELFIVPQLVTPIKYRRRIEISRLNYLKNLELAHPLSGEESFNIDILIGADFYWKFVEDKVIRGDGPTAVLSKLGYLLSGPIHSGGSDPNTESLMMNILADHKLEECVFERFWNIESLGIENQNRSENYTDIAKEYADTSIEFLHGKYTAKLPWKAEMPELQSNFGIVKRRTENVIRRLGRDPDLLRMYSKVLSEQEEKGFIERVDIASDCTNRIHYIPHHPVLKESATTPVRVVYDCSCRDGNGGASLNDCLESHSPNLNDLPGILTRFRLKQYALTTDIEKAFLQIGLHQEDRDVNPSDTAQVLERDLYVDNVLSSFDEKQRVIGFYHESRELLAKGGFNLHSWNSNCENLRTVASKEGVLDTENVVKILGMLWNVMTDMLLFSQTKFDISGEGNTTKRDILKQSSRIFDPLGILSPITVKAKILLQTLWKQNFGWDEHLPKRIETEWKELAIEIEEATSTKVPRHLLSKQYSSNSKTLHVFTDASLQAYGAVLYIVDGEQSNFVMAKNRVAPIKSMTLPRLELMGALLGARLVKYIQNNVDVSEVSFWCDSQIVINWISSNKQLKQFIQNRVIEIKDLSGGNIWRYCPTCDNPADFLTRGIPISKFKGNKKWLHGPDWILEPNKWPVWNIVNPSTTLCVSADDEFNESKSDPTRSAENSCHREPFGLFDVLEVERFGSYMKLLRVVSYIFRFIGNCRKRLSQRNYNSLKCEEMKEASVTLLRAVQRKSYIKEMDNLKSINTKRLPLVKQLRLYLDNNGLLRCGGRINNAPIEESTKFPYLLPPKCHFTELIIKDAHEKQKHGSLNNTITFIQQTYWIPKIRQCVKKILRKCLPCLKIRGKPYQAPDPHLCHKIDCNVVHHFLLLEWILRGRFTVEHDGKGFAAGWFLDRIVIHPADSPQDKLYFLYNGWIARDIGDGTLWRELKARKSVPTELTIGTKITYNIEVHTGTKKYAGTDANVFIKMCGSKGTTKKIGLDDEKNNFERDMWDRFDREALDVGPLEKIIIGHDNFGPGAGWFLDKVKVTRYITKAEVMNYLKKIRKEEKEADDKKRKEEKKDLENISDRMSLSESRTKDSKSVRSRKKKKSKKRHGDEESSDSETETDSNEESSETSSDESDVDFYDVCKHRRKIRRELSKMQIETEREQIQTDRRRGRTLKQTIDEKHTIEEMMEEGYRIPLYDEYVFECQKWFAKDEGDGLYVRELPVSEKTTFFRD
ncbi:hypothetical protein ScPMuIL_014986 [Solemya velum]